MGSGGWRRKGTGQARSRRTWGQRGANNAFPRPARPPGQAGKGQETQPVGVPEQDRCDRSNR